MAIAVAATRDYLANQYAARATHATVTSTVPGSAAGTEIAGVARVPITWSTASGGSGQITGTVEVTGIPAGSTVQGASLHTALTGGTYVDGGAIPTVTYPAGGGTGKYQVTFTYTQS